MMLGVKSVVSPLARVARAVILTLIVSTGFPGSGPVAAAPSYVDSEDVWNGIGYLIQTGREAKVAVEPVPDELDLSELRPGDVVLWLYPQSEMPVDELAKFVADGGFLIVADDHGTAEPLFKRFGILRTPGGPTSHRDYFEGQDGLPILRPDTGREHFLYFNVSQVVANHPAVLTGAGDSVYSFETAIGSKPEHLVIERIRGRGRFMAIGDPSVFINDMIGRADLHGNKQFAANVMRRNCTRECKVKLALPSTTAIGSYRERGGPLGELPRMFDDAAQVLNESLSDASETAGMAPWSWLIAALLALLAATAVSKGLRHVKAPRWGLAAAGGGKAVTSPLVHSAIGLSATHHDADFADLAQTLIVHVTGLDNAGLAPQNEPGDPLSDDDTVRMAERAMLRIRGEVASFQGHREPPLVSSDRFLRLYDDVRLVARFAAAQRPGRKRPPA